MNTASLSSAPTWIPTVARIGLTAKGIVYFLLGILAFMAAFEIGGASGDDTNKTGVFSLIQHQFAGQFLLGLLILGLLCYCFWRGIQAFYDTEDKGGKAKGLAARSRYLLSGLVYLSFAVGGIKLLFHNDNGKGGDSNQEFVAELLTKPFGQYLAGIAALIIAGVGIYQVYYGVSGKYKKHVTGLQLKTNAAGYLLKAGIIGYVARGITWLIIAWLMLQAAINSSSKEAGDTTKAFKFLESSTYGSLMLGLLGIGLLLYGVFNFVRARFEHIKTN